MLHPLGLTTTVAGEYLKMAALRHVAVEDRDITSQQLTEWGYRQEALKRVLMILARWFTKLKSLVETVPVPRPKKSRYKELDSAHFVSDSEPLVTEALEVLAWAPVKLPPDLMPGFLVSGNFMKVKRSDSLHGEVTIWGRTRCYPEYEGIRLYLYPESFDASHAETYEEAQKSLKNLYREALRSCLAHEKVARVAGDVAVRQLARQANENNVCPEDREFLKFLERTPIFPTYQQIYDIPELPKPDPVPPLISLEELLLAESIYMTPEDTGPCGDTIDPFEERHYSFEVSRAFTAIARAYSLPLTFGTKDLELFWSPDPPPPEPPPPKDPKKELAEALHPVSLEVEFGAGQRREKGFIFPSPDSKSTGLKVDFKSQVVIGSDTTGQNCRIRFSDLTEVYSLERDVRGDMKVHEYRYLVLGDGQRSLVYYERFKDYFGGGSAQRDLNRYQNKGKAVIECLAGLSANADSHSIQKELRRLLKS